VTPLADVPIQIHVKLVMHVLRWLLTENSLLTLGGRYHPESCL
jgi:hypothetical protein